MAPKKQEIDRTLAILAHILSLVAGFIPALIIFLVAKDNFSKENAKNALNWQISSIIYMIVSFILIFVLIGFLLFPAVIILNLVFTIIATVKASNGETWKYPLAIPFVQ